jgi:hypothetical protein
MIPRLALSVISLLATLTIAEIGLRHVHADPFCVASMRGGYWTRPVDERIHTPGAVAHESRWCVDVGQQWAVDVTIDDHGRRTTPAGDGRELVALGCSFTFGWGVEDIQAWPAQYGTATGWTTRNCGVSGYGPIETARQLRAGHVVDDVTAPALVVYAAIDGHRQRVVKGTPEHPAHQLLLGRLAGIPWAPDRILTPPTVAALETIRDLVTTRWPGVRFVVLSWPRGGLGRYAVQSIRAAGIEVLAPPSSVARGPLHRYDGHPSADEHASVAGWLAEEVGT